MTTEREQLHHIVFGAVLVVSTFFIVWRTGSLNAYLPIFLTPDGWNQAERELNPGSAPGEEIPQPPTVISAAFSDGTTTVTVHFDTTNETVTFAHPELGTVSLPRAISESGARYASADEQLVLWEHQDEVTIAVGDRQLFRGTRETTSTDTLTEAEARTIAEQSCIKGGRALSLGTYNKMSKTWWFDANLNAVREGCSPACVVSEETQTVETTWRCTGIEEPEIAACGIENCHGLDVVCGPNPAEMCTMLYQLGDKCRQYVTCGVVEDTCELIENEQFTGCKTCVEECERDFPDNPAQAFECESMCL